MGSYIDLVFNALATLVNDFTTAWKEWLHAAPPDAKKLWGWPILYWARVGKLIEFAAACAVIVDIIGPERINNFGQSLKRPENPLKNLLKHLPNFGAAWKKIIHYHFVPTWGSAEWEKRTAENAKTLRSDRLHRAIMLLLVLLSLYIAVTTPGSPGAKLGVAGVFAFLLIIYEFLLAPFVEYPVKFFGSFLGMVSLPAIAAILKSRHLQGRVKIWAFLLLVVGFHFDFLGA